jgi:hypothetical protein
MWFTSAAGSGSSRAFSDSSGRTIRLRELAFEGCRLVGSHRAEGSIIDMRWSIMYGVAATPAFSAD